MKKLIVFMLAVFLAVGVCGTALSQDTVELSTATSGVSTVFWGPVFSTHTTGASAYVATGTILDEANKNEAGTTLYAISNTLTSADGTEMRAQVLKFDSGSTPIGSPQLLSGTSSTVILYVMGPTTGRVGSGLHSGGTLYSINGGTGAVYWTRPIAVSGYAPGGLEPLGLFEAVGLTPFCLPPVTIDNESIDTAGATIYGVSGVTRSVVGIGNGTSGVSIWAIDSDTGGYAATPDGNSNVTSFEQGAYSGVSTVQAAPVISGTSLFVLGWSQQTAGITIFQFVKNNLLAGVSAQALVNGSGAADLSDQWIPTPAVSGGSIFVVDNNGGVSAYRVDNLALQYSVDYAGNSENSGVSAGPVTNGTYIVLCGTSSITGYPINRLSDTTVSSGGSKQWTFDFGANKSIWATPAISNGFVWVIVNDTILGTSTLYRFTLSDTFDGNPMIARTFGQLTYGSPAIVGQNLWTATYDPTVQKVAATGANGANNWPQFKFDKSKTGNNSVESLTVEPGSSGGCFISTIK